jgi:hypothetical protein
MALAYVGGTVGTGTDPYNVSLNGTLTGGLATSPATDDIVVVFAATHGTAQRNPTVTGNNAGAYTGAHTALYSNDNWDTTLLAQYKVQGATPDTSLSVVGSSAANYGSTCVVQVWRGVDTGNPIAGTPTTVSGAAQSSAAMDPPALDPGVAGSIIIAGGAGAFAPAQTAGYTGLSGMSNVQTRYADGAGIDSSLIVGSYAYAGVSYDPPLATGGVQNNAASSWAAVTMALRPAASGAVDLTIQDAGHAHSADAATLTVSSYLAAADASHAHSADNLALVTDSSLAIADAAHAHAADSIELEIVVPAASAPQTFGSLWALNDRRHDIYRKPASKPTPKARRLIVKAAKRIAAKTEPVEDKTAELIALFERYKLEWRQFYADLLAEQVKKQRIAMIKRAFALKVLKDAKLRKQLQDLEDEEQAIVMLLMNY